MQILQAYKPFEIQEIELSNWRQRPVKNNFFEVVLIKTGKGTQCINYNFHDYKEGNIFLLPPLKCHSFQIEEPSKFIFLKFTSGFFSVNGRDSFQQSEWFKEAAYILSNYNQLPGDIIHYELDRQHIYSLVNLIVKENNNHQSNSLAVNKSLMTCILEILLRNIKQGAAYEIVHKTGHDHRVTKLLTYINENISQPQLLKVEELAKTFLLSPTYLSEFFRKNVKMSLREYIIKAKLKLVEIRLLNSDYTFTQIAQELNFTDVSHLSKHLKNIRVCLFEILKKEENISCSNETLTDILVSIVEIMGKDNLYQTSLKYSRVLIFLGQG